MPPKKSSPPPNLHRNAEIRTPCPNPPPAVHNSVTGATPAFPAAQQTVLAELERLFRSPSGLHKSARRYALRARYNHEDLLSAAIILALETNDWDGGVAKRLDGIMSSKAFSINRSRRRRGDPVPLDDAQDDTGSASSTYGQRSLTPHEELVRETERRACIAAVDAIIGDDLMLERLFDSVADGLRGQDLEDRLEINVLELAALRKKLNRRAAVVLRCFQRNGQLDVDALVLGMRAPPSNSSPCDVEFPGSKQ